MRKKHKLNLEIPETNYVPVDTGSKLNVHTTFRRRQGRHLNVLCTLNLRPVSTGVRFGTKSLRYLGPKVWNSCHTI